MSSSSDDAVPRHPVGWLLLGLSPGAPAAAADAAALPSPPPPVFLALERGRTVLRSDDRWGEEGEREGGRERGKVLGGGHSFTRRPPSPPSSSLLLTDPPSPAPRGGRPPPSLLAAVGRVASRWPLAARGASGERGNGARSAGCRFRDFARAPWRGQG